MAQAFRRRPDFEVTAGPVHTDDERAPSSDRRMQTIPRTGMTAPKVHSYLSHVIDPAATGLPDHACEDAVHLHLIHHPARILQILDTDRVGGAKTGLILGMQATLHDRFGGIVIDMEDLTVAPCAILRNLCRELGLSWADEMLWPSREGSRDAQSPAPGLQQAGMLRAALPFYRALKSRALTA
ncbi:hypothetical protein [Jannaschia sp. 2305UL9-9]|uniref:sulfotransferase-like domain-containing protein n=1 Tax=Jannaschia sp. 2305UL9-9 TaxID=3121638 RepID=UPI0035289702